MNGGIPPLILLNGSPISFGTALSIPPQTIDFIDILSTSEATIFYGEPGAGGAVAIYTKSAIKGKSEPKKGILSFTHPGYYQAREFYTPVYEGSNAKNPKPDYRPVLFWKPTLHVEENEPAHLSFFTGDVASTFEVQVEGISEDGRPFTLRKEFVVK